MYKLGGLKRVLKGVISDMHDAAMTTRMVCRGCEAKDEKQGEQIGFDISSGSSKWRGYILSHTMTQPLMGQRSDALISLIDGLEAYNSLQREG